MARASQFSDQKAVVLEAIYSAVRQHSKVPTVRELAVQFDVSPATMHSWLSKLAEEDLVAWTPGRHRSLRCTPKATQLLSSPAGQST